MFSPDFTVAAAGGTTPASAVAVGSNGATSADVISGVNLNLANDQEDISKDGSKNWSADEHLAMMSAIIAAGAHAWNNKSDKWMQMLEQLYGLQPFPARRSIAASFVMRTVFEKKHTKHRKHIFVIFVFCA